jgi:hypothetical protein
MGFVRFVLRGDGSYKSWIVIGGQKQTDWGTFTATKSMLNFTSKRHHPGGSSFEYAWDGQTITLLEFAGIYQRVVCYRIGDAEDVPK